MHWGECVQKCARVKNNPSFTWHEMLQHDLIWPYRNEFMDVANMNLSPEFIFNLCSESFKAHAFSVVLRATCATPSPLLRAFPMSAFSPSHSLFLSVSRTSCSLTLKSATFCRSVDQRAALHPESKRNVNDMMVPSKATLTLLSFSFFKCKGWPRETIN